MNSLFKPSSGTEKVAGHVATEVSLTVVGVLAGGALAPLLPILAKSLASERQRQRVEEAIGEITNVLASHSDAIHNLSDSQYKFINEAILALLHSTNPQKIHYLRQAVRNGLLVSDIQPQEAVVLSRVIRDISADEVVFLMTNFRFERVQLWPLGDHDDPKRVLAVAPESPDGLIVSGLIALGLLSGAGPIVNDMGRYAFSPIVAKLLVLVRDPHESRMNPVR
jgi:hypothetical protein